MGRRSLVSKTLHSELSEYSSLIRALRTESFLDVTSQLTNQINASSSNGNLQDEDEEVEHGDEEEDPDPDDDDNLNETRCSSSGIQYSSNGHASDFELSDPDTRPKKRRRVSSSLAPEKSLSVKRAPRELWTRWPLLVGDVLSPHWQLVDEVKLLFDILKDEGDDDVENTKDKGEHQAVIEADEDTPKYVAHIAASTARRLQSILGAVVSHMPYRAGSLQNRLKPVNWEMILDIVASHTTNEKDYISLDNVRKRMSQYCNTSNPIEDDIENERRSNRIERQRETLEQLHLKLERYGVTDSILLELSDDLPTKGEIALAKPEKEGEPKKPPARYSGSQ